MQFKRAQQIQIPRTEAVTEPIQDQRPFTEIFGIWQSVGDTTGPGGLFRALRTIPMFEEFAAAIRTCCPDAWVINYTNPMTLCVKTLYRVFPQIKAFGCCHEVFGTQELLGKVLRDVAGIPDAEREDIKVNVVGVNHFTWLTAARYQDIDLYPLYRKFAEKYRLLPAMYQE